MTGLDAINLRVIRTSQYPVLRRLLPHLHLHIQPCMGGVVDQGVQAEFGDAALQQVVEERLGDSRFHSHTSIQICTSQKLLSTQRRLLGLARLVGRDVDFEPSGGVWREIAG